MTRVAQFDTKMLKDGYTPTEAMVYGYLWWITHKTKIHEEISPSIWLMKKTLNISRSSVLRAISKLEEAWLIEVARVYREKNTYYVIDLEKYPPCSNFNPDY